MGRVGWVGCAGRGDGVAGRVGGVGLPPALIGGEVAAMSSCWIRF